MRFAPTPSRSGKTRTSSRYSSADSTQTRLRTWPSTRPARSGCRSCWPESARSRSNGHTSPARSQPKARAGHHHVRHRRCRGQARSALARCLPALPYLLGRAVRPGHDRGNGLRHARGGAAPRRRSGDRPGRSDRGDRRSAGRAAAAIGAARRLDPWVCRKHVEQNFTVEVMAARYETVYRRAIRSAGRASISGSVQYPPAVVRMLDASGRPGGLGWPLGGRLINGDRAGTTASRASYSSARMR